MERGKKEENWTQALWTPAVRIVKKSFFEYNILAVED